MEQATMALQTAKDTQVVVAGMKAGVKEMKKEFKKIYVDKIEVCFSVFFGSKLFLHRRNLYSLRNRNTSGS